jgi:hypothetical protein
MGQNENKLSANYLRGNQKTRFRNVLTANLHNVPEEVFNSLTIISGEQKKRMPNGTPFPIN